MTETVRETKRADELKPGDWAAEILGDDPWSGPRNGQISFTTPYTDEVGNRRVLVVAVAPDSTTPEAVRPMAETSFQLLTDEDRAKVREQADRAKFIAGLREFADWIEANPWAPLGWDGRGSQDARVQVDLHGAGEDATAAVVARVRECAERMGVKVDESHDDRTDASIQIGAAAYSVIAWHRGGRPAEPAPAAEDLGDGFDRSQTADADDTPIPVTGKRHEPHTGGVTDEALVDETGGYSVEMRAEDAGRITNPKLARFLAEKEDKRRVARHFLGLEESHKHGGDEAGPVDETEPPAVHRETSGWKGEGDGTGTCGVECACGVSYGGFDTLAEASELLARHIANPLAEECHHGPDCSGSGPDCGRI